MRKIFWLLVVSVFSIGVVAAQQGDCPALVEKALTAVGNACPGVGRNQVCYGNFQIETQAQGDKDLTFGSAGDTVNVADVASLTTLPLDVVKNTWGVAVMALQANLPDTLPGQNVTFLVFGDVVLENDVKSDAVQLDATAPNTINIRTGPGTNYSRGGSLDKDTAVKVVGRNDSGNWLQILYGDHQTGWVSASLMEVTGDVSTISVVNAGPAFASPMQAFRIRTQTQGTSCEDAPPNGLMIQSPEGVKVDFMVNGVQMNLGSTALVEPLEGDSVRFINLSGHVNVTSDGEELDLKPGESVDVTPGDKPGDPGVYGQDDINLLPLSLLPDPPSVPPVITDVAVHDIVGDGSPNSIPISFANADGDAIVKLKQKFISSTAGVGPSGESDVTPADYENPYGGILGYSFSCTTNGTISVTYDISIVDAAGNESPPFRYKLTCSPP